MNITVLGAGAWGTALALSLSASHSVMLWGRSREWAQRVSLQRENRDYLPGFLLPDTLLPTSDFEAAIAHAGQDGLLLVATSLSGLRPISCRLVGRDVAHVVWLCKGFEEKTGLLPHQIVHEVLGEGVSAGVLSGPSFAQEVARGLPCALVMASSDAALCQRVVQVMHGRNLRVYTTEDVIGVEVGGASKNILAIAAGITDGLQLGNNARAALMTRGLAEMTRLGVALGARAQTFTGLAGMGDLVLTCTGDLSRNRRVGLGLAQGKPLKKIVSELGHVAEGVRCAQVVRTLAAQRKVNMPITNAVAAVLFDGAPLKETIASLLTRNPRTEEED